MIKAFRGLSPTIAPDAFIADTAVVIGDVTIGPESSIWYGCVVRGDVNSIRIGSRSNVQDQSTLHVTSPKHSGDPGAALVIGDDVTIGHRVILHGCTLGNGCFIGMGATIMDRAVVGDGALVGAGSLIAEGTTIPPGTVWIGSPARYRRDLTGEEKARLSATARNYVTYGQQHREEYQPRD